jgi:hypothetical protein
VFHGIRAIMIFAEDPEKSARWWAGILESEVHFETAPSTRGSTLPVSSSASTRWTRIATGAAEVPCRTGPSTTSTPHASASSTPSAPTTVAGALHASQASSWCGG